MQDKNLLADIQNASLKYKTTIALDKINLSLPKGQIIGFIGPDGVGKSSLLGLIAGAKIIQEGDVFVFGE